MAIKIPEVSTCCCYFTLKTGALVFGVLGLIGSIFLLNMSYSVVRAVIKDESEDNTIWLVLYCFLCLVYISHIIVSTLLLFGAYKERKSLVVPWLVSAVFVAVVEAAEMGCFLEWFVYIPANSVEWVISTIIGLIDDVYGFLVVYSYYRSLYSQGEVRPV